MSSFHYLHKTHRIKFICILIYHPTFLRAVVMNNRSLTGMHLDASEQVNKTLSNDTNPKHIIEKQNQPDTASPNNKDKFHSFLSPSPLRNPAPSIGQMPPHTGQRMLMIMHRDGHRPQSSNWLSDLRTASGEGSIPNLPALAAARVSRADGPAEAPVPVA